MKDLEEEPCGELIYAICISCRYQLALLKRRPTSSDMSVFPRGLRRNLTLGEHYAS